MNAHEDSAGLSIIDGVALTDFRPAEESARTPLVFVHERTPRLIAMGRSGIEYSGRSLLTMSEIER